MKTPNCNFQFPIFQASKLTSLSVTKSSATVAFALVSVLTPFNPSMGASRQPLMVENTREVVSTTAQKAQAEKLLLRGVQQLDANQVAEALESFQQALEIQQQMGDRYGEAVALNNMGVAYYYQGDYEQSLVSSQQSMKIFWELYERSAIAATLNNQSIAKFHLGEYQRAIELCHGAIGIFRTIGDRTREAVGFNNTGMAYEILGDNPRAIGYFEEALATAQDIGDPSGEVFALNNLAEAYNKLGKSEQAREFEQQAMAIAQTIETQAGTGGMVSSNDRLLIRQHQRSLVLVFSSFD